METIEGVQYKSLYEYLDAVLSPIAFPTNEQIIQAKSEYWKLWYREYRQQRRKHRKEFTLGFDKKQLAKIQKQKGNRTISSFLYQTIEQALHEDRAPSISKLEIGHISQNMMHLMNLLEEFQDEKDSKVKEEIFERLGVLENQFQGILKQICG